MNTTDTHLEGTPDKEEALRLLRSSRGNLLLAEALHHFVQSAPYSSNREDMAFMLESIWPGNKKYLDDLMEIRKRVESGESLESIAPTRTPEELELKMSASNECMIDDANNEAA